MKMKTTKENLLSAAKIAARATEKKSTMPILQCLLIEADRVTGCDLKRQIVAEMERIDGLEPTAVPAQKLVSMLTALPPGAEVKLKQEDGALIVRSGRSRFKLNALHAEDYPSYTRDDGQPITDAGAVIQAMDDLRFACPKDDARHYLNGLMIEYTDDQPVTVVGTDGKRLAARRMLDADPKSSAIVPSSAVDDICALFSGKGDVTMRLARNVEVSADGVTYSSNLVEGRYPDWRRIIPEVDSPYTLNRGQLSDAVNQAAIVANTKIPAARLTLESGAGKMESNNPEHDELIAEIDCETTQDAVEVGFALPYLRDLVGAIDGDTITLQIRSSNDPMIVKDGSDTHLIAPMRL
jgi:DNA polymerase-3 subunit beta